MRLVERDSTSLSLSWDVFPRPRVQSQPIRYELAYRKKVWKLFNTPWQHTKILEHNFMFTFSPHGMIKAIWKCILRLILMDMQFEWVSDNYLKK